MRSECGGQRAVATTLTCDQGPKAHHPPTRSWRLVGSVVVRRLGRQATPAPTTEDPSRNSALGKNLRVLACGGMSEKQLAVFSVSALGFVAVLLVAFWFVGGLLD